MALIKGAFAGILWTYWVLISILWTLFLSIFFFLLSISLPKKYQHILHFFPRIWAKGITYLALCPVEVKGKENALDPPSVIIANHQSAFDIFVHAGFYPKSFLFVSKKEVFKIPVIGFIMRKLEYIPVERQNPRKAAQSALETIRKLKTGYSVLIYPEGTRSPNADTFLPFKAGTLLIASKGKIPIVPMVTWGPQKVLKPGRYFYLMPHKIRISILPPIFPEDPLHPSQKKDPQEQKALLEELRELMQKEYDAISPKKA